MILPIIRHSAVYVTRLLILLVLTAVIFEMFAPSSVEQLSTMIAEVIYDNARPEVRTDFVNRLTEACSNQLSSQIQFGMLEELCENQTRYNEIASLCDSPDRVKLEDEELSEFCTVIEERDMQELCGAAKGIESVERVCSGIGTNATPRERFVSLVTMLSNLTAFNSNRMEGIGGVFAAKEKFSSFGIGIALLILVLLFAVLSLMYIKTPTRIIKNMESLLQLTGFFILLPWIAAKLYLRLHPPDTTFLFEMLSGNAQYLPSDAVKAAAVNVMPVLIVRLYTTRLIAAAIVCIIFSLVLMMLGHYIGSRKKEKMKRKRKRKETS